MSESERKKRLEHRARRKKVIILQIMAAVGIAILMAFFIGMCFRTNVTHCLSYKESGGVDYKVYLKDNDFYEEDYLGKDQVYVASLIDYVVADFDYAVKADTEWVDYRYSYSINGRLIIADKDTGKSVFEKDYVLKEKESFLQTGLNQMNVKDSVKIDYVKYNNLANSFVNVYNLTNVACSFKVVMSIDTNGNTAQFDNIVNGSHSMSLNIPLTLKTIDIRMVTDIPSGINKVSNSSTVQKDPTFKNIAIALGVVELAIISSIIAFTIFTRNHDINYDIKIKRLVSAYKSYIQKILTEFDPEGYQMLKVETFNQMLDIRDTVSRPILMYENHDRTCTRFIIPTDDKLLYVHEIKVEDYDEIYAVHGEQTFYL